MDDLVLRGGVDHHAEGPLVLGVVGQVKHPKPPGDAATYSDEYRHIRRLHHRPVNRGLRGKRVDRDNSICVDVPNNRHVGGKGQGFDSSAKHPDARALRNAGRNGNHMAAQGALISRHTFSFFRRARHAGPQLLSLGRFNPAGRLCSQSKLYPRAAPR